MQTNHQPSGLEVVLTLAGSAIALAVLLALGHLTPDLLLALFH